MAGWNPNVPRFASVPQGGGLEGTTDKNKEWIGSKLAGRMDGEWIKSHEAAMIVEEGDVVARRINGGKSLHTGVYVGDGEICHRNTHDHGRTEQLDDFTNGHDQIMIARKAKGHRDGWHSADAARRSVSEGERGGRQGVQADYHRFNNNCQHFTSKATTGNAESPQVTEALGGLAKWFGYK